MAPAKRKRTAAALPTARKTRQNSKQEKKKVIQAKVDESFYEDHGEPITAQMCVFLANTLKGASVHVDGDLIWDAALNQTNIGANNNKFYFIQILHNPHNDRYYTHTRWGRVGELYV
jgi:poly [ADP-ribose] polymerase 2/3/4